MLASAETISVVIPTYNRSRTIEYCVKSILEQTLLPNEIIIIDDASTDNTESVITSLNNNLIKFIKLDKNAGAQAARNIGIKNSKSKWIAFLDSDDKWEKNKLELQFKELERVNFDKYTVIHGDCYCFDTKKNKKWIWNMPRTEFNCYKELLSRPSTLFPTLLVSKQAAEEIGYLDENVPSYQEWDTSIRLAKKCKFIHIEKPLFTYIFHDGDTISKNHKKDIEGYLYIINKFKKDLQELNLYEEHLNILIRRAKSFSLFKEAENISKYYNDDDI